MNREQIVHAINEAKKDLERQDSPNANNMAQNNLEVLRLLLWRWDYSDFYDYKSDFASACDNVVEELIEVENERIQALERLKKSK